MDKELFLRNLSYNLENGEFTWIVDKKGHIKIGDIAGALHNRGYIRIMVGGKSYLAHRIAIVMSGGSLSSRDQVDHINGNRKDNRLSNLRLATHAQNCHNASVRKDNLTGFKGVSFDKKRNQWRARIMVNKKSIFIGYFLTLESAHAAYKEASIKLHGEFSRA